MRNSFTFSKHYVKVRFASAPLAVLLLAALPCSVLAEPEETCIYQTENGAFKSASSRSKVPARYRRSARCVKRATISQQQLARPDEVTLEGNIRRERLNSSVGTIELRWPRSVEPIFGRTPLRAMTDAARTVSRATRTASFPSFIQNMNLPWNVVFMDENLSDSEIPKHLISNCHPGWMTPPANIYIVAQRVAAGCSGSSVSASVADSQLTEVLVHEMGHAVEFHLLNKAYRFNRMRSEGFATWFETYAAQYSSFINRRDLQQRNGKWAKIAIRHSPDVFTFSGSAPDYARASMYFAAIEDRFGVRGVVGVYERMIKDGLDFFKAVQKELLWNRERLEKEARRTVEKL